MKSLIKDIFSINKKYILPISIILLISIANIVWIHLLDGHINKYFAWDSAKTDNFIYGYMYAAYIFWFLFSLIFANTIEDKEQQKEQTTSIKKTKNYIAKVIYLFSIIWTLISIWILYGTNFIDITSFFDSSIKAIWNIRYNCMILMLILNGLYIITSRFFWNKIFNIFCSMIVFRAYYMIIVAIIYEILDLNVFATELYYAYGIKNDEIISLFATIFDLFFTYLMYQNYKNKKNNT